MSSTHAMGNAIPTLSVTLESPGKTDLVTLPTLSPEHIAYAHARAPAHARDTTSSRNGNPRVTSVGSVTPDRSAITITFRAEGDGPPLEIRARQFLKLALRRFGLRCIHNVYATSTATVGDAPLTPPAEPAKEAL